MEEQEEDEAEESRTIGSSVSGLEVEFWFVGLKKFSSCDDVSMIKPNKRIYVFTNFSICNAKKKHDYHQNSKDHVNDIVKEIQRDFS